MEEAVAAGGPAARFVDTGLSVALNACYTIEVAQLMGLFQPDGAGSLTQDGFAVLLVTYILVPTRGQGIVERAALCFFLSC